VGGLGHYFEGDGLATTQVSLVREHTVIMKPPRALWVPFEMGRPIGVPNDPAFQKRVVLAALGLLESDAGPGPLLVDFPDDAPTPDADEESSGWVCPINLAPPVEDDGREPLLVALEQERARLVPWHEVALQKRGGSSVGSSAIPVEDIPAFIVSHLGDSPMANPRPEVPDGDMLIFACDDLRAYYFEAVTAQPGQASSDELVRWFWDQTTAAKVMWALKDRCSASDDPAVRDLQYRFAPDDVVERREESL
jgi:hypothetical protein